MRPVASRPENAINFPFGEITAGPTVTSKSNTTFGGGRIDEMTTGACTTGRLKYAAPSEAAAIVAAMATIQAIAADRARVAVPLAAAADAEAARESEDADEAGTGG